MTSAWVIARGAYGAVLCCAPGPLIRLASGQPADSRARAVARLLGARHLAQAVITAARPSAEIRALGAEVDLLHAASMLALATADAPRRRLGLTDGLIAATFAADGLAAARRAASPAGPASQRED